MGKGNETGNRDEIAFIMYTRPSISVCEMYFPVLVAR
jgi:hypothetical protein